MFFDHKFETNNNDLPVSLDRNKTIDIVISPEILPDINPNPLDDIITRRKALGTKSYKRFIYCCGCVGILTIVSLTSFFLVRYKKQISEFVHLSQHD